MAIKLCFAGAAREVTGSMHVVEVNGHRIALDCGLFQGRRAEANEKNRTFPCNADRIDAVILSHAHIDHCGRLPLLVRNGFTGPIYATHATRDLVEILLADSAHIQEEDTAYWNKKRVRRGDAPIEPLYTAADVEATLPLLQVRRIGDDFEALPGVWVTLHETGHMLGSAGMHLAFRDGDAPTSITYSGDIGRPGMPILRNPEPFPPCDYLICESTYGNRSSPDLADTREQFAEVINETIERGGKLIIPAFAVGRTQVLAYHFHRLVHEGRVPEHVPMIVDSPLALRATEVFRRHTNVYNHRAFEFNERTGDMLRCDRCEYIENVEQSKALHGRKEPMLIISASGMCETGRILHHLKNNVEDPRNTVMIAGFQAAHTLGRRIAEKQKQIRIFGEMYRLRAKVRVLTGFSAHADAEQLLAMTEPLASRVRRAFLVHGEPDQSEPLAAAMRKQGFASVTIPDGGESHTLEYDSAAGAGDPD